MDEHDDAGVLRGAGLRVTTPRLAVLRTVGAHPHATADDVLTALAAALPTTSHQAVYGVLNALTGAGLVRRIEPAGSPARFERRTGDNHHHVVCTLCGAVEDVDCAVGHAPCLTPSETHGFAVTTAEVTYWGICEACAAAERDDTDQDDVGRADAGRDDAGRDDAGRDETGRDDTDRADTDRADTGRADSVQADTSEPHADRDPAARPDPAPTAG